MANAITRLLQRRSLRRAVHQALNSGVGLYHASWPMETSANDSLADELIAWCRQSLSTMHRPYGVDSVSLAIAAIDEQKRPLASANFAVLRPTEFYTGPLEAQARDTVRHWSDQHLFEQPGTKLSVVLFSWGDLTQELLLAG